MSSHSTKDRSLRSGAVQAGGRLSRPPHPVLFELLYEPNLASDIEHVLPDLLAIDAAHLVMLENTGILDARTARDLVTVNRELEERRQAGEEVLPSPPSHRGLYLLYEHQYIERLGATIGGASHVARSRNDINATVTRLRLREVLSRQLAAMGELIAEMLRRGEAEAETVMSGFTHLQPAQPTTFGHYLSAVAAALLRSMESLADGYARINLSPMGAAAALGTSFPVDRELVAELLGFDGVIDNSLDAVASRDYVVAALSDLAMFGNTLTRFALDLQVWGSWAYGFMTWPDELVSTSSIMPQKRNAYVLENIRGQAAAPTGALVNALHGMKNTPFTNGVEVGSEATAHLWGACSSLEKAVRLTHLLVANLELNEDRMLSFFDGAGITMTALADVLVDRHGLAFRTAHDIVGRMVRELDEATVKATSREIACRLPTIVDDLAGRSIRLTATEIEEILDVEACVERARHGGGPAPATVRAQLAALTSRHRALVERAESWRQRREAARTSFEVAINALL